MADPDHAQTIKLGFLEETDIRLLKSHFFPSKVGGKPSWLSLNPIPNSDQLQCSKCNGPCIFLMQVYAPLQMREDTFHRTIFFFVCPNASCSSVGDSGNFKVFRSQLPLVNNFYSKDPPEDKVCENTSVVFPHAGLFQTLCQVCGCKGTKKCSQCKKVYYCTKAHQVSDWKAQHKKICTQNDVSVDKLDILFKELELVTEDEDISESDSNNSKSEVDCQKELQNLRAYNQLEGAESNYTSDDLEQSASAETVDDKQFQKFKRRISHEPTQVLRYSRGGEPLWASAFHKPASENIPSCSCGAPRIYEFQVMPQLLNYLKIDRLDASLDWATLCVYTCKESCDIGNSYHEEFLWKQDFQNTSH